MKTILFQGDSITDCGRHRERHEFVGDGYVQLVKAQLGYECPEEYEFQNRGIGGNRIVDVYARIKTDIINVKPDVMSMLVGVNDVWQELNEQNGVDAEKYEKIYCMMIEEIKEALPNVKIMIMEPFCLRASATDNTEEEPDRWNKFQKEVQKRAEKARKVADKYQLPFIALQDEFDKLSELATNTYWLRDGVHPTQMGHELIKREWLKAFSKLNF